MDQTLSRAETMYVFVICVVNKSENRKRYVSKVCTRAGIGGRYGRGGRGGRRDGRNGRDIRRGGRGGRDIRDGRDGEKKTRKEIGRDERDRK